MVKRPRLLKHSPVPRIFPVLQSLTTAACSNVSLGFTARLDTSRLHILLRRAAIACSKHRVDGYAGCIRDVAELIVRRFAHLVQPIS